MSLSFSQILKSSHKQDPMVQEFKAQCIKTREGQIGGGTLSRLTNWLGYTKEYHASKFLELNKDRFSQTSLRECYQSTDEKIQRIILKYLNASDNQNHEIIAKSILSALETSDMTLLDEILDKITTEGVDLESLISKLNGNEQWVEFQGKLKEAVQELLNDPTTDEKIIGKLLSIMKTEDVKELITQAITNGKHEQIRLLINGARSLTPEDSVAILTELITPDSTANKDLILLIIKKAKNLTPEHFVEILNALITLDSTADKDLILLIIKETKSLTPEHSVVILQTLFNKEDLHTIIPDALEHLRNATTGAFNIEQIHELLIAAIETGEPMIIEKVMTTFSSVLLQLTAEQLTALFDVKAVTTDPTIFRVVVDQLPMTPTVVDCLKTKTQSIRLPILQQIIKTRLMDCALQLMDSDLYPEASQPSSQPKDVAEFLSLAKSGKIEQLKKMCSNSSIPLEARQYAIHQTRNSQVILAIFENSTQTIQKSLFETALLKAVAGNSLKTVEALLKWKSSHAIEIDGSILIKAYKLANIRKCDDISVRIVVELKLTKAERQAIVKEVKDHQDRISLCDKIITPDMLASENPQSILRKWPQYLAHLTAEQREVLGRTLSATKPPQTPFFQTLIHSFLNFFMDTPPAALTPDFLQPLEKMVLK